MAHQKMKFKMNIKELSFEYEGDFEQGQKIQTGITTALAAIGNLQNGAMGIPPVKPAEAKVIEVLPPVRTRRRRKRTEVSDSENGATSENGDGDGAAEETGAPARKASGSSPTLLLKELRKSGFFEGGKSTSDIVTHVRTKGHTKLHSGSFTAQLVGLCKKDVLDRKQDPEGGWKYYPGSKDE